MFQQLFICGNLGSEPVMSYTNSGTPVTHFSVAANKRFTNQAGQLVEKTTWFRITVWRKLAETCAEYLSTGRQVLIVGEVEEAHAWTDDEGNARASIEVTANGVRFLGGRPLEGSAEEVEVPAEVAAPAASANRNGKVQKTVAKPADAARQNGSGKRANTRVIRDAQSVDDGEKELEEAIPF